MKLLTILAMFFTLAPACYAEGEDAITLDPGVQQRLADALKNYRPQGASLKLTELHQIDNVGNFGKVVEYQRDATWARQDSGLWAIVAVGGFTSGGANGMSQTLSLCGLLPLLTAVSSTTQVNIPLATRFGPFMMRHVVNVGRRGRVTDFRTEYGDICSPSPGAKFTYQFDNEVQIRTSSRTVTGKATLDVSCEVASDAAPATQLAPSFRGDYLRVSCENVAKSGQKTGYLYAFLREPGVYLTLSESGSNQSTKMQYKAVEYGP